MSRLWMLIVFVPLLLAGCPTVTPNVTEDPNDIISIVMDDPNDDSSKPNVASPFDGDWLLTGEDLETPVCVTILYGKVVRNDVGCDGNAEDVYAGTQIAAGDQSAEIRWQYMLPNSGVFCHEWLILSRVRDGEYAGTCTAVRAVRESGRVVDVNSVEEVTFARE